MIIRREQPADQDAVRAITAAAFERPEAPGRAPMEVKLLDDLRAGDEWLPRLSLVAAVVGPIVGPIDGPVVGHVVCSRAWVDGRPVVALGPISVRPDHQRRGIGLALVHAVLGAADALDEPLVVLVGNPAFYGRFGFRLAEEYEITPPNPDWHGHFQVRTLATYTADLRGPCAYAPAFDES